MLQHDIQILKRDYEETEKGQKEWNSVCMDDLGGTVVACVTMRLES